MAGAKVPHTRLSTAISTNRSSFFFSLVIASRELAFQK